MDPYTPGNDSANNTVRIRKSDNFRKSWDSSKLRSKKIKPNQSLHVQPSSQQSTRLSSVLSQVSNLPSGHSQSNLPRSPLYAKVQNIQYLEYELHKFRMQRLEEAKLPIYIPPMAKANLQARDDDIFPLKEKVQEFLASDRKVMLILGDSGAGKSNFNKHLESELLHTYTCGGPIPLFINLPAIREPDCDMIEKQLKSYNFNDEQIRELKLHRQLILICDGYDESQLTVNLHTVNLFNRPGQWNVKMVISCRTQFLGQEYRSRFMPEGSSHYQGQAIELFQEAVMAPFTKEQIEDYVEQYVPLEPRSWTAKDYMDKLTTIPNLIDL
ncbi:Transducin (beta)-like 1 X-linked receptor 1, partial [Linnemannia elongata]